MWKGGRQLALSEAEGAAPVAKRASVPRLSTTVTCNPHASQIAYGIFRKISLLSARLTSIPLTPGMRTLRNPLDRDQIFARLQKVSPSSPRRWGLMTPHQMICHLCDGYKLYLGSIVVASPDFPYPSLLLKWGFLWVPIPWPKGFKTPREIDQQKKAAPSNDFDSDVAELRHLLNSFTTTPPDFPWPDHPYIGHLSEKEWMRLGYLHADHHLRQFGA